MGEKTRTQQRWREVVLAQKAGGLSPGEFCKKEKICRTSFYAWRKRLGMTKDPGDASLVTLLGGESRGPKGLSKGFMRLIPPVPEFTTISVQTPNEYRVEAGYVGEGGLKRVLEILRAL